MLVLLLPPPNTRRAVAPLRIRVAPLLALLLRRAVRVEVVELAAGEHEVGASDQVHILMGGHPTVFVKKQEGGPCDHLTLS